MGNDRERIADIWIRATRLVGALAIPALVGLVIVAPDFVQVVLGPHWARATPVIQILALGRPDPVAPDPERRGPPGARPGGNAAALHGALVRRNRRQRVALGLHWGIVGVAACYAVATTLVEPLRDVPHDAGARNPASCGSRGPSPASRRRRSSMAAVLVPTRMALVSAGVPPAARLVLLVLLGAAIYAGACMLRAPEVTNEVRGVFRRRTAHPQSRDAEPLAPRLSED